MLTFNRFPNPMTSIPPSILRRSSSLRCLVRVFLGTAVNSSSSDIPMFSRRIGRPRVIRSIPATLTLASGLSNRTS